MLKLEINEDGLIICPCCKKPLKMINGTHTKKCSGLNLKQFHEKYQTERYLFDQKMDLLLNHYVLDRYKFLNYYPVNDKYKVRTIKVGDGPDYDRKFILSNSEIKKHLEGKSLLGVYFYPSITKVLCFDIDTKEPHFLMYLVHVLYKLGFKENNILISFSGSKGYHLDILFGEPVYRDVAQGIYDYIHYHYVQNLVDDKKRPEPTLLKKLECRGGTDDRGYKLPMGKTFINGEYVYCYPCTEEGNQIPAEEELKHIKSKEGISEPDLAKIFQSNGIPYRKFIKWSEQDKKEIENRRASRDKELVIQKKDKKTQISRSPKQKTQQGNQNSNLTFNFRKNSKARCQDYINLILLRNRDCEGFRNELLFEYAVSYKVQLTTVEGILREIKRVNQEFKTPIKSENELKTIAKSAMGIRNQFKTETIIRKLKITRQEQEQLEVIRTEDIKRERKNRKRKEKREVEREEKRTREYIEIKRRLKRGETVEQIAGVLGIHRATVYRKIKREKEKKKELPIRPKNATQVVAPRFSLVESPLLDAPQCSSDQVSAEPQANYRKVLSSNHNSGPPGSRIVIA